MMSLLGFPRVSCRLVENDRIEFVSALKALAALDEDPVFRAEARSDITAVAWQAPSRTGTK